MCMCPPWTPTNNDILNTYLISSFLVLPFTAWFQNIDKFPCAFRASPAILFLSQPGYVRDQAPPSNRWTRTRTKVLKSCMPFVVTTASLKALHQLFLRAISATHPLPDPRHSVWTGGWARTDLGNWAGNYSISSGHSPVSNVSWTWGSKIALKASLVWTFFGKRPLVSET